MSSHSRLFALFAFATLVVPSRAYAQAPCVIPPAGEVTCEDVTIDDVVRVRGFDAQSAEPSGYLHIRARSITVAASGVIDATGSGFATAYTLGIPGDGAGPGGGRRGTQASPGAPAPGGGGAHVGLGGQGLDAVMMCALAPSALGGGVYDDAAAPLALMDPFDATRSFGSAGAASHCGDSGDQLRAGGRGGGLVMLTAATIRIDGAIRSDGEGRAELGGALFGCGPGAGAGGAIILNASNVTFGAGASLSAAGGESPRTMDPATQTDATNSWGGAGGGGLITVIMNGGGSVDAGVTAGGTSPCLGGEGGLGALAVLEPVDCLDADRDGFPSEVCGGTDCHDGSADDHPDAEERCDGVDNDCDGEVDEAPASLCPEGSATTCIDGACVPMPGGTGGAAADVTPPEVVLGGGLCAAAPGAPERRGGWAWLAVAALGIVRRRRMTG